MIFTVQPTNLSAGSTINPAVQVKLFDQYGNLTTNDSTDQVRVSIASGPGAFAAGSTTLTTVKGGIATFSNLGLDTAGTYTLGESASGGLTGPNSNSFTVSPGVPTHMGFFQQPSNTMAGIAINPPVQVQLFDRFGNLVTTDSSDQVTLSVASGPGNFVNGSTTTVTVSGGIATFDNLVFDTAGTYTLGEGASDGLVGPNSISFTILVAAANHLEFSVEPSDTVAGSAIQPAVQVKVFDQFGNLFASDNSDAVTLSIASGPGGFDSVSTTTATVSGGIATFSNLVLDTAGTYTLGAISGNLTGPNSTSFTVSPLGPDHIGFEVQPTNTVAGVAIGPVVAVFDRYNNLLTTDYGDVATLTVATGPGGFASRSTTTAVFYGGIATFTNLVFTTAGNYTLAESATDNLTGSNSNSFTVNPSSLDHLGFSVEPSAATAGSALGPAVQVKAFDQYGNLRTNDSSNSVLVYVISGSGGFTSDSSTTATLSDGIATFTHLVLDMAGTYTLGESSSGYVTGPSSSGFIVSPAAPDHVSFPAQPGSATAGTVIGPALQADVFDKFDNLITSDNSDRLTLSVASGPGIFTSGSTLTATVSGGVATFRNLVLDTAGYYTFSASATSGLTSATSAGYTVNPYKLDHIAFSVEPSDTTAGTAIGPEVELYDEYGNLLTPDTSDRVSLNIVSGPGGFTDGSTTITTVSGGIATFGNVVFDTAGSYILGESMPGGLTGPNSVRFNVGVASPDHLSFSNRPADPVAGTVISPALQVQVLDEYGNLISGANGNLVSVNVASGPGSFADISTTTATSNDGVATLSNLILDTAGNYTLTASSNGLKSAVPLSLKVTAAAATHLVVTAQPDNSFTTAYGIEVMVSAEDPYGNVDPTFSGTETIALAANPGGSTLGGTLTQTAYGGVAVFSGLTFNKVADGYQLQVSTEGFPTVTTNSFDVTPGKITELVVVSAPTSFLTAQTGFSVQVAAQDTDGNINPAFTGNIAVSLTSNPSGGVLGGPQTAVAQAGVATFSDLTLSQGGPYTLSFSSGDFVPTNLNVTTLAYQLTLTAPAGVAVATLIQGHYSDGDSTSKPGIAVTQESGNGVWQYSANGKTWVGFGTVSAEQSLLLPENDQIRFVPGLNGVGQASLVFVGWDGSQGKAGGLAATTVVGGTTAFSLAPAQVNLTVTPIQRAPSWLPGSAALTPVLPDGNNPEGDTITNIFGGNFNDATNGTTVGVAVAGQAGKLTGTWQYSLDGGATWLPFGKLSTGAARLLSGSDRVRFVPTGTTTLGSATLQAYAWDGSKGNDGGTINLNAKGATGGQTALSQTLINAGFAINDAPVLSSTTGPVLPTTLEDGGGLVYPVGNLLNTASDPDKEALKGVAIVAASGPGTWQYSLNGQTWLSMGTVSESVALLLPNTAQVRFLPGLHQSGQAKLSYRAWDETAGTAGTLFTVNGSGGAYAFSSTEAVTTLTIEPINHAPTWTGTAPQLTPILPDTIAPSGESIDSIFSGNFSDVDGGTTIGIAVTGLVGTGQGSWEYLLSGSQSWQTVGHISPSTALLLSGIDQIRFVPASGFTGTVSLQAYAWDGSSGSDGSTVNLSSRGATGGTTAFSTTSLSAPLAVDISPTWIGSGAALTPVLTGTTNPAGDSVAAVFGAFFSVGTSGTKPGIAVTALTGTANGIWQYSLDGGTTWNGFETVSTTSAPLLSGSDLIRFVPTASFAGTVSLEAYAWDGSSGSDGGTANLTGKGKTGGNTAFSATTLKATCLVNEAPVLEA